MVIDKQVFHLGHDGELPVIQNLGQVGAAFPVGPLISLKYLKQVSPGLHKIHVSSKIKKLATETYSAFLNIKFVNSLIPYSDSKIIILMNLNKMIFFGCVPEGYAGRVQTGKRGTANVLLRPIKI
uniref:Uncharacterized protein n=1 Tax=Denticeps clupeoides TaxID=299321 RepID=A0AAY4BCY2_9TELE